MRMFIQFGDSELIELDPGRVELVYPPVGKHRYAMPYLQCGWLRFRPPFEIIEHDGSETTIFRMPVNHGENNDR